MQLPTSLLYTILTLLPPSLTLADYSSASHNASLLWGPYRPNLYMGIRPRVPDSLFMGLMWGKLTGSEQDLRHTCEASDDIAHYGWDVYDSRHGGIQSIHDKKSDLMFRTSFVKISEGQSAGNWALRVAGNMMGKSRGQKTRVVFYVGMDEGCKDCVLEAAASQQGQGDDLYVETVNIHLQHSKLGTAEIRIPRPFDVDGNGKPGYTVVKSLQVPKERPVWAAKSLFLEALSKDGNDLVNDPGPGNMHFVQLIFQDSFEFDILYSSQSATVAMSSKELTRELNKTLEQFDSRFASVFIPKPPFGTEAYVGFGKSLLSNLQGGLSYFQGDIKVDYSKNHAFDETTPRFWEKAAAARKDSKPETKGHHELFSHVPSRYGFPRGFLWDEGFHLLTILNWDADLALEVVRSWFSSVDENGWIPREQILGEEARSIVPEKFIVQFPNIANPPTLFWIVSKAVDMLHGNAEYAGHESKFLSSPKKSKELIEELYPKMKLHYEWWRKSQVGDVEAHSRPRANLDEGYRWRGRTPETNLASGLDDYPRPEPPSITELHVDALSWVGVMAETMAKLSRHLDNEADIITFQSQHRNIRSNLEALHWSEADKMYCDTFVSPSDQRHTFFCPKGYVALFPFLTGALGPEHAHLNATLDIIHDPKHLWTDHGVRSLSPESPAYGTSDNYWRSPIWININYLIIERLLDLAQREGPLQDRCREIYIQLRANVVATVYKSWTATATHWEQYDAATGRGLRTPGFTGWTALVLKIMAFPDLDTKAGLGGFGFGAAADVKGTIGWAIKEAEEQGTWGAGGLLVCVGVMVFVIVTRRRFVGSLRRLRRSV